MPAFTHSSSRRPRELRRAMAAVLGLLLMVAPMAVPASRAAGAGDYLYLSRGSTGISRVAIDGTGLTNGWISTGGFALGVTATNDYVYWANYSTNYLGRANLDGTGANTTWVNLGSTASGMTTDGSYLYIGRSWANRIARVAMDGTGLNADFITTSGQPAGVAVTSTHVYWTNFANGSGTTIGRANIDGTGVNNTFITGLTSPTGLATDGTYLYWGSNSGSGAIGRALLDGTGVNTTFITGAAWSWGVTVGNGKIYFDTSGAIGVANLDGSGVNLSLLSSASGLGRGVSVGGVGSPVATPTPEPTVEPTVEPTPEPTIEPSVEPTIEPTPGPAESPSAGGASLRLERSDLVAGGSVQVEGDGFKPTTEVELWLRSDPILLRTVVADGAGAFATTLTIPTSVPAGDHHIVAVGQDPDGQPLELASEVSVTHLSTPATDTPAPNGVPTGRMILTLMGLACLGLAFVGWPGRTARREHPRR